MIRNDKEYRYTKNQLSELGAELQRLSSVGHYAGRDGKRALHLHRLKLVPI